MLGADVVLLMACLAWTRRAFLSPLLSDLHGIGMLAVVVVCGGDAIGADACRRGKRFACKSLVRQATPMCTMSRGGLLLGRHAHAETPWGLRPRVPYP